MTAFLLLTVVTLAFAFRPAPVKHHKALDSSFFIFNGGTSWSDGDEDSPEDCPIGSGAVCVIEVFNPADVTAAKTEAQGLSGAALNADAPLPSGKGFYYVRPE